MSGAGGGGSDGTSGVGSDGEAEGERDCVVLADMVSRPVADDDARGTGLDATTPRT